MIKNYFILLLLDKCFQYNIPLFIDKFFYTLYIFFFSMFILHILYVMGVVSIKLFIALYTDIFIVNFI